MGYTMSQDRNPYYDSARDKPDRSEFASLRMDIQQPRRSAPAGISWVTVVIWVVGLVIIAAVAKRFLLT
ncbi:MAG: hypothetical protein J7603_25065 [Pseudacidovorax sp.]|nr:hypothetical protein [Pseudacidovorax sp.]